VRKRKILKPCLERKRDFKAPVWPKKIRFWVWPPQKEFSKIGL
jgi:hypothetical protein